jgi:predicted phosphoribosyltransferase
MVGMEMRNRMLGALGSTAAMLPARSQYSGVLVHGLSGGGVTAGVSVAEVITAPLVGRPIAAAGIA